MAPASERGRVAIVTGAAGGIGGAIALTLAQRGWRLLLADRDADALRDVEVACRAQAVDVASLAVDVTREDAVADMVAQATARLGRLDGLVSNAGVAGLVRPVDDYPTDVFEHTLAVNVLGTFLCLKHGLPAMRASGGSFVALASTSAIRGRARLAGYVASKHAVLGLVRSAALECVGSGVRVNAVLPGPTQTAMIDAIKRMAAEQSDGGPIGRAVSAPLGTPQDVANAVAFLLSPAARHMQGAELVIDGGSTLA